MNTRSSKPPEFPRPSSAIARGRLHNRLLMKRPSDGAWQSQVAPPAAPEASRCERDGENTVSGNHDDLKPHGAVLGSSIWPEHDAERVTTLDSRKDPAIADLLSHMRSSIIESHSLEVPGMESLVHPNLSTAGSSYIQATKIDDMTKNYIDGLTGGQLGGSLTCDSSIEEAIRVIISGEQEYCYLDAVDPSNPYKLMISSSRHDPRCNRYITLSRHGIVRYGWGEPDQITLKQFVWEYYTYHRAIQIPFIKQFCIRKSFLKLRKYALSSRRSSIVQVNSLKPSLFILDPIMQNILLSAVNTCKVLYDRETNRLGNHLLNDITRLLDTQRRAAMKLDDGSDSEGDETQNAQSNGLLASTSMSKATMMHHLVSLVRTEGEKRATELLTAMPTVLSASSYFHYQQSHDLTAAMEMETRSLMRHASITVGTDTVSDGAALSQDGTHPIIMETPLSYTERAAIRLNCRRVASVVRVVDFMIRDMLYSTVESGLSVFLDKLNRLRSREVISGHINVSMAISDTRHDVENNEVCGCFSDMGPTPGDLKLLIVPNKETVMEGLSTTMDEVLSSGCHEHILLHNEELAELLKPIQNEIKDSSVEDLVFLDTRNSLHIMVDQCTQIIMDDMDRCAVEVDEYSFLCEMYSSMIKMQNELNLESLASMKIDEISHTLHMLDDGMDRLQKLSPYVDLGVIRLDVRTTVKEVLDQVISCKALYHHSIPKIFVTLGEKIYNEAHSVKKGLKRKVESVDDYVKVIEVYNGASQRSAALEEKNMFHSSLKEIMDDHSIPVSDEVFGLTATLKTEYQQYIDAMLQFEENREANIKNYKRELVLQSKLLQRPINELELRLASGILLDPESDPVAALAEVADLENLFSEINRVTRYITHCQVEMEVFVFDGAPVDRIQQQLMTHTCLWEAVKVIREIKASSLPTPFLEVDCSRIYSSVKLAKKKLTSLGKRDASKVESWILKSIELFDNITPIIEYLQAPTLHSDHKKCIEDVVRQEIFHNDAMTVGDIVDSDICNHGVAIEDIYHRSVCESNLKHKFRELEAKVQSQPVIIQSHTVLKSFTIIGNIRECSELLEDMCVTATSALQSNYICTMKESFEDFLAKVRSWKRMMMDILKLQEDNLRLRVLFTSSRSTRYIHQALRHFNVVDEAWRTIIKAARVDDSMAVLLEKPNLDELIESANDSVQQADVVIDTFILECRDKYPKFYLMSREDLFAVHAIADTETIFEKCRPVLFPNVSSLILSSRGELQITVDGIHSGSEALMFRTPCSTRGTLGDWFKSLESAIADKLQSDITSLVTENRKIMDDARNPFCCDQARILTLQIQFWKSLKDSMSSDNASFKPKMQRMLQLDINDRIAILTTILSTAKSAHQIICAANMMLCLLQLRDLMLLISEKTTNDVDAATEPTFVLNCALQKIYNRDTSTVIVRHSFVEKQYGMVYHGFHQRMVVTPLTEKCYLAISSTFGSSFQSIPFLRGPRGTGKRSIIQGITHEFGQDLCMVDCAYEGSTEYRIRMFVAATEMARLHTCFVNVEKLEPQLLSVLVSCIAEVHMNKPSNYVAVKVDVHGMVFSRPHFSVCMNVDQSKEMIYFPSSIRKKFRPIHVSSPPLDAVLEPYLVVYGFSNAYKSSLQLTAFLEHVKSHCGISSGVIFKILFRFSIPKVAGDIIKVNKMESAQQCYMILKDLFKRLPNHFHESFDLANIQHSCNIFLGITFDVRMNETDFKGRVYDPLRMLVNVLTSQSACIVVGGVGTGKSTLIRQAVAMITGYDEDDVSTVDVVENSLYSLPDSDRRDDVPNKLYPHIINPVLLESEEEEIGFTSSECEVLVSSSHSSEDPDRIGTCNRTNELCGVDKLLRELCNEPSVEYVHLDVPNSIVLMEYGRRLNYYHHKEHGTRGKLSLLWESCEIANVDPAFTLSMPIVCIQEPIFSVETTLQLEVDMFCKRFENPNDTLLRKAASYCVDTFILPLMHLHSKDNECHISVHAIIRSLFRLARCMYENIGLSVHPDSVDMVYVMSNANEQEGDYKRRWDKITFCRIMLYCCIWSFGTCSTLSSYYLDNWFGSMKESATKYNNDLPDILPPTLDPFDYCLVRLDDDEIKASWVHWKEMPSTNFSVPVLAGSLRSTISTYSTCSDYETSQFVVPTKYSIAATYIQRNILQYQASNQDTDCIDMIALLGDSGVGKSSIVFNMVSAMSPFKRWLTVVHDSSPTNIIKYLEDSRDISSTYFVESNFPSYGAVFVDDVNFSAPSSYDKDSGAELYRSMISNKSYFDKEKGWVYHKHFYCVLCGTLTDNAKNSRLLGNCFTMILSGSDIILTDVMSSKLQLMCPFIQESLAFDIAYLSVKLYDQIRHLDCEGLPLSSHLKHCPSSWRASNLLESLRVHLEDLPVVSSGEIGKTWKRALNSEISGSFFERQIYSSLDKILNEASFRTSNLKNALTQSFGRQNVAPRFATTVALHRMSALKNSSGSPAKIVRGAVGPVAREEKIENRVFVGLMSVDEIRDKFVNNMLDGKACGIGDKLDIDLVDTGNAGLWRDVHKVSVFLVTPGHFGCAVGSVLPFIKSVLKMSCVVCDFRYKAHLLDHDMSLRELNDRVVNGFCLLLLSYRKSQSTELNKDFSLPNSFAALARSTCIRNIKKNCDSGDENELHPILWHLHLESNNGVIDKTMWKNLYRTFNMTTDLANSILEEKYGIYPRKDPQMRMLLNKYVSSIKMIVSFGPYTDISKTTVELSLEPTMTARIRNVHFSPLYGVNMDLLSSVFSSQTAEMVSASISEVVLAARDSDLLETSSHSYTIQSQEYTQGTYDFIIKIFNICCAEQTKVLWDKQNAIYLGLTSMYASVASSHEDISEPFTEGHGDDGSALGATPIAGSVQHKLIQSLSDIVLAVVKARYVSLCPLNSRAEYIEFVLTTMANTVCGLKPRNTDPLGVVYSYYHTVAEVKGQRFDKICSFIDSLVIIKCAAPSVTIELSAVVLAILVENTARVGGNGHFFSHVLCEMCGLEACQSSGQNHGGDDAAPDSDDCLVESLLRIESDEQHILDIANPSTTIICFDSKSFICPDIVILFYLAHGGCFDKSICDAWKTLYSSIIRMRNTPMFSKTMDAYMYQSACRMLALQWKFLHADISPTLKCLIAFVNSTLRFPHVVHYAIPQRIVQLVLDIIVSYQSTSLRKVLIEVLDNCYIDLVKQLPGRDVYYLQLSIVANLNLSDSNNRTDHISCVLSIFQKYIGSLGLIRCKRRGMQTCISPETKLCLEEALTYIHTKWTEICCSESVEYVLSLLVDFAPELEAWANAYSKPQHVLPMPQGCLDQLNWIENLLIILALKPLAVDSFIDATILNLSDWKIPEIDRQNSTQSCTHRKLVQRLSALNTEHAKTISIFQNYSQAFDTSISGAMERAGSWADKCSLLDSPSVQFWPISNSMVSWDISSKHGSVHTDTLSESTPLMRSRSGSAADMSSPAQRSSINITPFQSVHVVAHPGRPKLYNLESDLLPALLNLNGNCAVESIELIRLSYNNEVTDTGTVYMRCYTPILLMKNYVEVLNHVVIVIMAFHDEHILKISKESNRRIPRGTARVYWILALFHTAVLLRVCEHISSIGDDTLRHATKTIMQFRTLYHTDAYAETLRVLLGQLVDSLYTVLVDNTLAIRMIEAEFENYFTPGSLDSSEEYYLLGVLPLPSSMDRASLDDFTVSVQSLLEDHTRDVGVVDFLGCTSGELSQSQLHCVVGFNDAFSIRSGLPPVNYGVNSYVVGCFKDYLSVILKLLPIPIAIESSEAMTLSSRHKIGTPLSRLPSSGSILSSRKRSHRLVEGSKTARKKTVDDQLWKFALLEVVCFNSCVLYFKRHIEDMMCLSTCPPSAAHFYESLSRSEVPPSWLRCYSDTNPPCVSLEEWVGQLRERRSMLSSWYTSRQPDCVKLHLLQNPSALLFVIKDTLARKLQTPIDNVKLETRVHDMPGTAAERNIALSKLYSQNNSPVSSSYSVVVSAVHLANARWEQQKYSIDFMYPFTASQITQELHLTITATVDDPFSPDDFQCPLYVTPDFPTANSIPADITYQSFDHQIPFLMVAMPSTCDTAEWAKRNVAMYSCPKWHLPK